MPFHGIVLFLVVLCVAIYSLFCYTALLLFILVSISSN